MFYRRYNECNASLRLTLVVYTLLIDCEHTQLTKIHHSSLSVLTVILKTSLVYVFTKIDDNKTGGSRDAKRLPSS